MRALVPRILLTAALVTPEKPEQIKDWLHLLAYVAVAVLSVTVIVNSFR